MMINKHYVRNVYHQRNIRHNKINLCHIKGIYVKLKIYIYITLKDYMPLPCLHFPLQRALQSMTERNNSLKIQYFLYVD